MLVGKQAANQARAANPRSPRGSTGIATDTNTHSRSLLRRRKTRRQDSGGDRKEEEEGCRGSERSAASASMKLRKLFEASVKLVSIVLLLPVTLPRCCEFATQRRDGSYIFSLGLNRLAAVKLLHEMCSLFGRTEPQPVVSHHGFRSFTPAKKNWPEFDKIHFVLPLLSRTGPGLDTAPVR